MFHIIANPAAGRGYSLVRLQALTALFDSRGMSYEVLHTTAPLNGYEKAKQACLSGSDGIIAVGGDGTVQEIVAGMADAHTGQASISTPLGILPCGSGNDFVLSLNGGKPSYLGKYSEVANQQATETLFNAIIHNHTRDIDILKANGTAYLNIGNVGLDARIVKNAACLKHTFGSYAYYAAVSQSIVQHKNTPLNIQVDGKPIDGHYTLVAVCNGQYYGGGMKIAPPAQLDNGKITVCLIEALSRPKCVLLFPSLLFAQHTRLKQVRFIHCDSLTITLPNSETLCLDGNLYEKSGTITFEIMPHALKVFYSSSL